MAHRTERRPGHPGRGRTGARAAALLFTVLALSLAPAAAADPAAPGVTGAGAAACLERYLHECNGAQRFKAHRENYVVLSRYAGAPSFEGQGESEYEVAFQISVRLRPTAWGPLYIAYTQRSYYLSSCCSTPFREHVANPEVYLDYRLNPEALESTRPGYRGLRLGLEHESNGRDSAQGLSRDWNRLFVEFHYGWNPHGPPAAQAEPEATLPPPEAAARRERFTLRWKLWLSATTSPVGVDLADTLGHTELTAQWRTEAQQLTLRVRPGVGGDTFTVQTDYAFAPPTFLATDALFLIQYFDGVGETLLDYDQRHARWLVGVLLTR